MVPALVPGGKSLGASLYLARPLAGLSLGLCLSPASTKESAWHVRVVGEATEWEVIPSLWTSQNMSIQSSAHSSHDSSILLISTWKESKNHCHCADGHIWTLVMILMWPQYSCNFLLPLYIFCLVNSSPWSPVLPYSMELTGQFSLDL